MKFLGACINAAVTVFFLSTHLATALDGYGPLPSEVSPGDEICVYGFVMDEWCIVDTGGTLLDMPSVTTLLNPEMHSFHCLLDVGVCNGSPYHILTPPGEGETMYGTGWQLSSNDMVIESGRAVGSKSAGCTTCGDTGSQARGFRASVSGTVVTTDPPVLDVQSVSPLIGDAEGCTNSNGGGGGGETIVIVTNNPTDPVITDLPTDTPSARPSTPTTSTTRPPTFSILLSDVSTLLPMEESTDPSVVSTDPPAGASLATGFQALTVFLCGMVAAIGM
ncbi:hypothetical protein IV203_022584 [Nitzschia inconspicua]|uniref:Uncharacterized protein n=1 Tax=Nitzschia inconspicua TaxID=303405 RepID=A0A9K3PF48_9STRA|nr:hypothetical protein IV203_022584 [Nitzschia inconspicua]